MWGRCGKVYGVSGEVCWRVGKGCGEGNGEDVGKCVEVWGPNTFLIPHISLPSPFPTSPLTSPTPHHTFLHLSYLFPIPSFLPPHPNTFSYYPHVSLHLLKVWRSYHVAKLLWRSYHMAKFLATQKTYQYTGTVVHRKEENSTIETSYGTLGKYYQIRSSTFRHLLFMSRVRLLHILIN